MAKTKPTTDKEMILDPESWPKWPYLPLVQRGSNPKAGLVVGDPDKDGKVFFVDNVNLFSLTEEFKTVNGRHVSVDDLLAEGWKVD